MIYIASSAPASVFDLNGAGHYLHWGFIQISVANAVVILSMILVFAGIGPMAVFSQDLIVGSVAAERTGSAAALSETSGDLGIAFGVAILGSVSAAAYGRRLSELRADFPPGVTRLARESVQRAVEVAQRLPAPLGDMLMRRVQRAFIDGVHDAAIASAVVSVLLAVAAVVELTGARGSFHNDQH